MGSTTSLDLALSTDPGDSSASQTGSYGVQVIKRVLIKVYLTVVPVGSMYTLVFISLVLECGIWH